MVELLRVDDRLLHGQVAYAWCKNLTVNLIVIANDEVTKDQAAKNAFALSKPAGVNLVISTVEKTIAFLNSAKGQKYSVLVLVKNMADAAALAKGCEDINAINVGDIREHGDSHRYTNAVCLDATDEEVVKSLAADGVSVYAQQVPADGKTDLAAMIK